MVMDPLRDPNSIGMLNRIFRYKSPKLDLALRRAADNITKTGWVDSPYTSKLLVIN